MRTIVAIILLGGNCMAMENGVKWQFKAAEVAVIQVEAEAGEIFLNAAEGPVKAEVVGVYDAETCELSAELKNSKLILSAKSKKKWFWNRSSCKAGFNVTAPTGTGLIVKSGAGLVKVSGFSAGAELRSSAGTMEFKDLSGPINIKSGAGTIKGEIYSEDFVARTGAGTIDVSWKKAPQKGKADIKSGAGVIALAFPADSRINVSYTAGAGSLSNELGSDPSAGFKVDVKSGAGSLTIKKR